MMSKPETTWVCTLLVSKNLYRLGVRFTFVRHRFAQFGLLSEINPLLFHSRVRRPERMHDSRDFAVYHHFFFLTDSRCARAKASDDPSINPESMIILRNKRVYRIAFQ